MGPDQIIYVSCNPGTLARDLGILQSVGYRVAEVQPVDMFPWTVQVETVILMTNSGSAVNEAVDHYMYWF